MGNIQIKDVSDAVHAELRRRAKAEGLTIRDYVLRLIEHDQARPSKADWLHRVRQLAPVSGDVAADVRTDRADRDRELDRRADIA